LLIFLFPPLFGEGYKSMRLILSGEIHQLTNNSFFYEFDKNTWGFLLYLFLIIIFKVIATSLTTGTGGVGGVFAPALFMGGISGAFFSKLINKISFIDVSESNFTLIGMAGLISGVVHAPLSAIFLIAEITGGYELFIPLILTSSLAYITVNIYQPHSIYTKKLAAKGELITHDKDKAVLTLLNVKEMIETDFISLHPDNNLETLVNAIKQSKRNIFPVVDKNNHFIGYVTLDEVRNMMFDKENYETVKVHSVMIIPQEIVLIEDSMETVMEKFNKSGSWNLPVVQNKSYIGFVSRSNVFNFYRNKLVEFSIDP
jgi:CIC family chloride channel protein